MSKLRSQHCRARPFGSSKRPSFELRRFFLSKYLPCFFFFTFVVSYLSIAVSTDAEPMASSCTRERVEFVRTAAFDFRNGRKRVQTWTLNSSKFFYYYSTVIVNPYESSFSRCRPLWRSACIDKTIKGSREKHDSPPTATQHATPFDFCARTSHGRCSFCKKLTYSTVFKDFSHLNLFLVTEQSQNSYRNLPRHWHPSFAIDGTSCNGSLLYGILFFCITFPNSSYVRLSARYFPSVFKLFVLNTAY